MKNNIYNYILLVKSRNNFHGCGFLLDKFFITAGHVAIDSVEPYIIYNDEKIMLSSPRFVSAEKNSPGYDLAIYELSKVSDSSLVLSNNIPKEGTKLVSYSYKSEVVHDNKSFIPNTGIEDFHKLMCDATVTDFFHDNYFGIISSVNLKQGCSGSPILDGNKVVGIITHGNNTGYDALCDSNYPLNFCCILSSVAIEKVLKTL